MSLMGDGEIPGGATRVGDAWELELPAQADVGRALAALGKADASVARFERVRPSLHQIFVEKVGDAGVVTRRPEVTRA
jgi:ABC-2 type transport system ATP-binding protein